MKNSTQPKFAWIAIEKIQTNPRQPRQWFDQKNIEELAYSIAEHGIIQPLVLDLNYIIIAGERRFRAAKWLGLTELPCMLMPMPAGQENILALIENLQREQMEPLEQAFAFLQLQQEHAWTHEDIAKTLGKSRVYVTNLLRLLKLSPPLMQAMQAQELSYGHARVLVGLSEAEQIQFLARIKQDKWSVRQLEAHVSSCKLPKLVPRKTEDALKNHFLQSLSEQVGTQVAMTDGWLKFKFFDQETLEGLLQKLGLVYD